MLHTNTHEEVFLVAVQTTVCVMFFLEESMKHLLQSVVRDERLPGWRPVLHPIDAHIYFSSCFDESYAQFGNAHRGLEFFSFRCFRIYLIFIWEAASISTLLFERRGSSLSRSVDPRWGFHSTGG